jgi:hypothetical protein
VQTLQHFNNVTIPKSGVGKEQIDGGKLLLIFIDLIGNGLKELRETWNLPGLDQDQSSHLIETIDRHSNHIKLLGLLDQHQRTN